MTISSHFSKPDVRTGRSAETAQARSRTLKVAVASAALLVLLAALAVVTVSSQQHSRSQILTSFGLRGKTSASFVSTFIAQQASREQQTAAQFLSSPHVSSERFRVLVAEFGSRAAVLLDPRGRLLDVAPASPKSLGQPIAQRYRHLAAAEQGKTAVSNLVPSAVQHAPVVAVAVPFATAEGRRVFSAAYPTSASTLESFVDHAIATRPHAVYLVDATGKLLAESPDAKTTTLRAANPALALAASRSSHGEVANARTPTTFTSTPVPGTPWRIVIAVPNSRLFASIGGLASVIPWLVLGLVSIFGVLLLTSYARSLINHDKLATLSRMFEQNSYTDSLTGLNNRRALSQHLTRLAAHARRHDDPLSVLMIDLDRFKETNDRFGHDAGDQVLCAVGDCMRDIVRAEDIFGRWGGDEFLMILPSTDETGAETVATRLRADALETKLPHVGLADGIPLSVGWASAVSATPDELLLSADSGLYTAKAGRKSGRPRNEGDRVTSPPPGGGGE
jgi:diguanylate cyclase (GGDEF)-like protein